MTKEQITITWKIEHELNAYIDDKRMLIDASDKPISVQNGISTRKKEIFSSLKKAWFEANKSLGEEDFKNWIAPILKKKAYLF